MFYSLFSVSPFSEAFFTSAMTNFFLPRNPSSDLCKILKEHMQIVEKRNCELGLERGRVDNIPLLFTNSQALWTKMFKKEEIHLIEQKIMMEAAFQLVLIFALFTENMNLWIFIEWSSEQVYSWWLFVVWIWYYVSLLVKFDLNSIK